MCFGPVLEAFSLVLGFCFALLGVLPLLGVLSPLGPSLLWSSVLVLCSGRVFWSCALVLCFGRVVLVLCLGPVLCPMCLAGVRV